MDRNEREFTEEPEPRLPLLACLAMLLSGLLLDMVVAPRLLVGFAGFRFLEAAVALCGMHGGLWRGILAGWAGGVLTAALGTEYLGFAIMRLALLGAAGGSCRGVTSLAPGWLEGGLVFVLLLAENVVGGLAGWALLSAAPSLNYLGIPATALVAGMARDWMVSFTGRPGQAGGVV